MPSARHLIKSENTASEENAWLARKKLATLRPPVLHARLANSTKPFTPRIFWNARPQHLENAEADACAVRTHLVHSETYSCIVVKIARCPGDRERVSSCGSTRGQDR